MTGVKCSLREFLLQARTIPPRSCPRVKLVLFLISPCYSFWNSLCRGFRSSCDEMILLHRWRTWNCAEWREETSPGPE